MQKTTLNFLSVEAGLQAETKISLETCVAETNNNLSANKASDEEAREEMKHSVRM